MVEQTENIGTIVSALSFQKDSRSGISEKQSYGMFLLGSTGVLAPSNATIDNLRALGDDRLGKILDACSPKPIKYYLYTLDLAGAFTSALNLLYGQVLGEVQGRIQKLKEQSHQSYLIRRTWSTSDWPSVRCIILVRGPGVDDEGKAKKVPIKFSGAVIVLQKIPAGTEASVLKPVYVRLDNSVAVTAEETAEHPAKVRVDLAFTLAAIAPDKKSGKYAVTEVTKQTFKTLSIKFGSALSSCPTSGGDFSEPCEFESEIFVNPPPKSKGLQISFLVSESGSALALAESAAKSLEAANKALFKPAYDQLVADLAKRLKN